MGRISRKLHTLLGRSQSPPPPPPPPPSSCSRSHDPLPIPIPIIRRSSSFARLPKPPAQLLRTSSSSSSSVASGKQGGYRLLLLRSRSGSPSGSSSGSSSRSYSRSSSGSSSGPSRPRIGPPPKGHLPIRLHDSSALYFVKAELLNHPVIADLLRRSAEEYGYPPTGALRVSCDAGTFEDIIYGLESSSLSP